MSMRVDAHQCPCAVISRRQYPNPRGHGSCTKTKYAQEFKINDSVNIFHNYFQFQKHLDFLAAQLVPTKQVGACSEPEGKGEGREGEVGGEEIICPISFSPSLLFPQS